MKANRDKKGKLTVGIPSQWYRKDTPDQLTEMYNKAFTADDYEHDGWVDYTPAIVSENQKRGGYKEILDETGKLIAVTDHVIDKTAEEIQNELLSIAQSDQIEAMAEFQKQQVINVAMAMNDDDANENQALFPFWKTGENVVAGDKRQDFSPDMTEIWLWKLNGNNNDHTTQIGWEPRNMQYAWERVGFPDEILKWKAPQAHNPYMENNVVWYPEIGDVKYKSTKDNNFYAPLVVSGDWIVIS